LVKRHQTCEETAASISLDDGGSRFLRRWRHIPIRIALPGLSGVIHFETEKNLSETQNVAVYSTSQEYSFAESSEFASRHDAEEQMRTFNRKKTIIRNSAATIISTSLEVTERFGWCHRWSMVRHQIRFKFER